MFRHNEKLMLSWCYCERIV